MASKMPSLTDADYRPGVGLMLLNEHGQVFVARRNDVQSDTWQMPQGGIEEGESLHTAVFRELKEEIGTNKAKIVAESKDWVRYDLPQDLIGKAWGGRWRGQRQKWYVLRFTGIDSDININTEHPEFIEWKWVPPDQLPKMVISFKRQLYAGLLAEFAKLPETPAKNLSELLADPIVRLTMAADSITEEELYEMLLTAAEHLKKRRHLMAVRDSE